MELIPAIIIGFLGSFHCIGMCSPIVLALPANKLFGWSFVKSRSIYNLGRVLTYSFLGAIFGLLGNRIALFGFQQIVSIILGVLIISMVIIPGRIRSFLIPSSAINYYNYKLKSFFIPFFKKGSSLSFFIIGILNGFLPCGFVYIGIAGAIAVSYHGVLYSILFMALFGAGTIPAMFGSSMIGSFLSINLKQRLFRLIPVFTLVLGIILVFRGLNLGIPYLSPKLSNQQNTQTETIICH